MGNLIVNEHVDLLDYLIANKQLTTRRIGTRVLIALTDLQRYARADHPKPLAS